MGRAKAGSAPEGEKTIANGVRVTLLHNSLASMDAPAVSSNAAPSNSAGTVNGGSLQ
jgi:hypothetical protein